MIARIPEISPDAAELANVEAGRSKFNSTPRMDLVKISAELGAFGARSLESAVRSLLPSGSTDDAP